MSKLTRQGGFALVFCLLSLLLVPPLQATNEVFLSNDTAQSEATYVIQFGATLSASVDKIRVALPPGTNAANAALGRLILGDKESEALMTVDPLNPDALIMDLPHAVAVKPGVGILVELFNLNNPVAGNYAIDVRTVDKNGNVIEVIPPIAFSTFPVGTGDITAVNAGTGLQGGGTNGDVTLSVNTSAIQSRVTGVCAAGSSIRAVDGNGNVTCEADDNSGGTVTSVGTGSGLTGGPITTTGTVAIAAGDVTSAHIADGSIGSVDVNSAQIQLRIGSSCAAGSSIRVVNADGTVVCEVDDAGAGGVTTVTASAPLTSSGGATPNISLPNVKIQSTNTAIGTSALLFNTTGNSNTASGVNALSVNDSGIGNTAIGHFANVTEDNLTNATAIGALAHVDASNKVRIGNTDVTVIEGQVPFTSVSDKTKKETFQPVDGEEVLRKIRGFSLTSWNYIGHDPEKFRHYGPMAQDFFAAFGNDGVGTIGTPTTINSGDMAGILMIAVQALEKQNREVKAENADLKVRLEKLERMIGSYAMAAATE